jgi:glucose/arabinose dehydrogenase
MISLPWEAMMHGVTRFFRRLKVVTIGIAIAFLSAVSLVSAQDAPPFDPSGFTFGLEPIATGFEQPVYVIGPDDGSGRLVVVERPGRIRIIAEGEVLPEPFLDITALVESGSSEQGLLSVAFPADFAESGAFYVYYTARSDEGVGDNTIARYRVRRDDPNRAIRASGEVLLAIPDFRVNHNGGNLQFGPDGFLYAGFGDGGGAGDPQGNAQNPATLFGSIARIDVNGGDPYDIPADNPFASGAGGAPESWVWGLRNPWRFSFDRATGDLWIGDVGQGAIEEVDWLPAGTAGGTNLGWNVMEGSTCFRSDVCDAAGLAPPIAEYSHAFGCSVVGGYVSRGEREPALTGVYLFGDYCSGLVWGLGRDAGGDWALSDPIETGLTISSFGEDAAGEVYLVSLSGDVFRVTGGD